MSIFEVLGVILFLFSCLGFIGAFIWMLVNAIRRSGIKKPLISLGVMFAVVICSMIMVAQGGDSEQSEEAKAIALPTPTVEVTPFPTVAEVKIVTSTPLPEPEMTIHFLDVGQGLSILVRSGEQNLIYDGGGRDKSSHVISYLEKQYLTDIDYLISSHYDEDHLAGLVGCLNAFNVKNVIGGSYEHDSAIYNSFMQTVSAKGLEVQTPSVGTEFEFGTGKFTILSVAEDASDSNESSIVIKIENGDNSFILTGDASSRVERDMCASGMDLTADVLSVSHHGSASATSFEFLEKVIPEYAVISCGKDNQYGHPDKDTMDKFESMDVNVFRTDIQGAVVVISNGKELRWDKSPCNDYSPGNKADRGTQSAKGQASKESDEEDTTTPIEEAPISVVEEHPVAEEQPVNEVIPNMVWQSEHGSKYHSVPDCGNMNPNRAVQITQGKAEERDLGRCKKCF